MPTDYRDEFAQHIAPMHGCGTCMEARRKRLENSFRNTFLLGLALGYPAVEIVEWICVGIKRLALHIWLP